MSQPFRPSALQRRILASLLHLIRTESSRLRALGVTVAPTVTVSDIYTDLAGDRGRSPPIQKVIADELTAVPGVEKVKPNIEITDAVWSMMNTLPPPRVAGTPAPPPPPPPPFYAHPRLPNESAVQLLHRLLGLHPEGLTVRQMRVLSGSDLAAVASNEKTAGRVAWERAEGSGAITYKPRLVAPSEAAEQLDQVGGEGEPVVVCGARGAGGGWDLECRMPGGSWPTPENADDVCPDVAPVTDASPTTGPATAEGGDAFAVVEVAAEHVYGLQSDDDTASWLGEPAGPAPAPHRVPAPDDVREPCPPLKIYVATSLDHAPRAVAVHKALEHAGHIITYRWTDHGSVQDQGVARLREVAEAELNGVRDADVLVAILPGGRGTHAEIGIAIGLGIPVVLLEQVGAYDAECAFYHAPGVHRYMWSEESVLPLLAFWAESVWLASRAPDAPHSIRDHHNDAVASWSRATSMLEDATIDLALARDTCINAGIPGAAVDAEGNTIPWGLPALVQRLAEQSAMHQDARSEAESAARTHLDEVDDLRKQLKASVQAELARAERITELEAAAAVDHQHRFGLQARIEELDKELNEVRANAQKADSLAKTRSLRIAELERNMLPPGLGEASLRTKLAAALGLSNDRPWSWDQLLVEALAAREIHATVEQQSNGAHTTLRTYLDSFRAFVGDVAAAVGISDHDRTEDPARTSVAVLEALQARLRPDQEAEIRETARLMREVEDRLRELVPGYSAPWACVVAINELAKKADAVDDARQILMDALDADTSPASLRSFPGEAAILGVARMAAAQLRHHRLPLAEQLAACRVALTDRINALDLAADLLGVA